MHTQVGYTHTSEDSCNGTATKGQPTTTSPDASSNMCYKF